MKTCRSPSRQSLVIQAKLEAQSLAPATNSPPRTTPAKVLNPLFEIHLTVYRKLADCRPLGGMLLRRASGNLDTCAQAKDFKDPTFSLPPASYTWGSVTGRVSVFILTVFVNQLT